MADDRIRAAGPRAGDVLSCDAEAVMVWIMPEMVLALAVLVIGAVFIVPCSMMAIAVWRIVRDGSMR